MDHGRVLSFEASCVVPDDPGEVVRGARPLTAEDAVRLREQMIVRLLAQAGRPPSAPAVPASEQVRRAMRDWQATRA
jgi:hypothetical protein